MNSLIPVLVCILIVMTFGGLLLTVAHLLGAKPKRPSSRDKTLPYECGLEGEQRDATRVPVQFYLTAILFILFDIEIIFLYPWALSFNDFISKGEGLEVLLAMTIFLAVFVYGLIWEIFSNALQWK